MKKNLITVTTKTINEQEKLQQLNFDKNNISKLKYEEKIIQVSRVTKVTTGGKKLTFRVIVVVGNKNKFVGVGVGRADDVNQAIEKAILNAKKSLIQIPLTKDLSIPFIIKAKYGASKVMIRPSRYGTGIIAGGTIKTVLELTGLKNVIAKQFGSNNMLNNIKATLIALMKINNIIEIINYKS